MNGTEPSRSSTNPQRITTIIVSSKIVVPWSGLGVSLRKTASPVPHHRVSPPAVVVPLPQRMFIHCRNWHPVCRIRPCGWRSHEHHLANGSASYPHPSPTTLRDEHDCIFRTIRLSSPSRIEVLTRNAIHSLPNLTKSALVRFHEPRSMHVAETVANALCFVNRESHQHPTFPTQRRLVTEGSSYCE